MFMEGLPEKNAGFPILVPLLLFALAAPAMPAQTPAGGNTGWEQALFQEREQKDIEFKTSATSPMAGRERVTVPAASRTFILVRGGDVSVSATAAAGAAFALLFREGKWFWSLASGVDCRRGERPVLVDSEALAPGDLFRAGRITLAAYPGPDALALIVFDRKRQHILEFKHLFYYPPDLRYALKARLEKFAEPKQVRIVTTRKLEKQFFRYARIHFRLEGREMSLTALKSSLEGPDSAYLFIPFKDATNGHETYEVGRFLDVPEPAAGEFILDLNRCYNPLCNYSPAYNCPLPPLENFLDVAIPAGEKAYPHCRE